MKKVILITNILSPYRIPLFNYINQNGNFAFKVISLAQTEKDRKWKINRRKIRFNVKVLPGWHLFFYKREKKISIHINAWVFITLLRYRPDIIITGGYDNLAYWESFLYCKLFRKEYILWNETTLLSTGSLKGMRGLLKKIIIKGANRYIACGIKSKEYLEYLGADSKNIYISIDAVDTDFFHDETIKYRNTTSFIKTRRLFSSIVLLYVGQLIKIKGVEQILKALKILHDPEITLMIVGSGPEEEALKKLCAKNKLDNVYFEGFHQQEELPKYYSLADIFILSSFKEVWGLVVNEALASGLYVLCSKYAGVAYDLINKDNGVIFDPDNVNQIAQHIKKAKDSISDLKEKRGAISSQAIKHSNIEKSGEGFISAICGR